RQQPADGTRTRRIAATNGYLRLSHRGCWGRAHSQSLAPFGRVLFCRTKLRIRHRRSGSFSAPDRLASEPALHIRFLAEGAERAPLPNVPLWRRRGPVVAALAMFLLY